MSDKTRSQLEVVRREHSLNTSQSMFVYSAVGDSMNNKLWQAAIDRAKNLPSDRARHAYLAPFHSRTQPRERLAFLQETEGARCAEHVELYNYLTRDIPDSDQRQIIHDLVWQLKMVQAAVGIRVRANPPGSSGKQLLSFEERVELLKNLARIQGTKVLDRGQEFTPLDVYGRAELVRLWAGTEKQSSDADLPSLPNSFIAFHEVLDTEMLRRSPFPKMMSYFIISWKNFVLCINLFVSIDPYFKSFC